jgi:hypothetical protein
MILFVTSYEVISQACDSVWKHLKDGAQPPLSTPFPLSTFPPVIEEE